MTRDKVHSMNKHTAEPRSIKIDKQNVVQGIEAGESRSYRHFLQLPWRQNH